MVSSDTRAIISVVLVALLGLASPTWGGMTEGGDVHSKVLALTRRAQQGEAEAQFALGLLYLYGHGTPQDYAEAMRWHRKAADQGHAGSQRSLGYMYQAGLGVPQDYAEAAKWYRKAADQGLDMAQWQLGCMYESGDGVPQNYAEAGRWYRKAADQGFAPAQVCLGQLYVLGRGVPRDYVRAYLWLNLGASQMPPGAEQEHAAQGRQWVAARLTPAQLREAQRLTRAWKPTPRIRDSRSLP